MGNFKYRKLEDLIKSKIINASLKTGDKLPTESELIKETGFSRQTVRVAINHLIEEGLLKSIQGSGTYVSKKAEIYSEKKTSPAVIPNSVTMILMDAKTYIFPEIINGASDILAQNNYFLNPLFTDCNYDKEREILINILNNPPAGLILEPLNMGYLSGNQQLYKKISEEIPCIFIHTLKGTPYINMPLSDYEGASKAIEYLIGLGHKNIGTIYVMNEATGQNRFWGYIDTLKRNHIPYNVENVLWSSRNDIDHIFTPGFSGFLDRMIEHVTAICCQDDRIAFKLIGYLESKGIRVPQDISVVGYDDSFFSTLTYQITTVTHPKYKYGQNTALALLELINTGKVESNKYRQEPKLIVRDSVAACPK